MPEDSIETGEKLSLPQKPKPEQRRVTRRFLLKAGAAAVGATALGWRESQIIESGIPTATGTFYPIYEKHSQEIDERDLRDDLDACFFEFAKEEGQGWIYREEPGILLLYKFLYIQRGSKTGEEHSERNAQILEKLGRNKTRIVFGDVEGSSDLIGRGEETTRVRTDVGILGASAYLLAQFNEKVPRRSFLKTIGKVALLAGIPPVIRSGLQDEIVPKADLDARQKDAVSRIVFRLHGLVGHLEPENHVLFFRNLIMADKILTVAEAIKEETSKKAKVAFNVGAAHAGMEDFLMAGHDFCRWLLSHYPPDFIEKVAEANGGLENLCTARVLTLPPAADLGYPDLQLRYAVKLTLKPEGVPIKDERIIDQPLFQSLSARLANALK